MDTNLRNMGINSKGEIVMRDTDRVARFTDKKMALDGNLKALERSIKMKFAPSERHPEKIKYFIELKEKLDKIKKEKGIK